MEKTSKERKMMDRILTKWHKGEKDYMFYTQSIHTLEYALERCEVLGFAEEYEIISNEIQFKKENVQLLKDMDNMDASERVELIKNRLITDSEDDSIMFFYPKYEQEFNVLKSVISKKYLQFTESEAKCFRRYAQFNPDNDASDSEIYDDALTITYDQGELSINLFFYEPRLEELPLEVHKQLIKTHLDTK